MSSAAPRKLCGVELEPQVWRWLERLPYETRQALLYDEGGHYESARSLRRRFWRAYNSPEPVRSLALTFAADVDEVSGTYYYGGRLPDTEISSITGSESKTQSKVGAYRPRRRLSMYQIGEYTKARDAEGNETGQRFIKIVIPPDGVLNMECIQRETIRENGPAFDIVYHGVPVGALWIRENTRDGGQFLSGNSLIEECRKMNYNSP